MLSSIPSVSLTTAASPKRDAASLYAADLPVQSWIVVAILPLSFLVLALRFGAAFLRILRGQAASMLSSIEDEELVAELDAAQSGTHPTAPKER